MLCFVAPVPLLVVVLVPVLVLPLPLLPCFDHPSPPPRAAAFSTTQLSFALRLLDAAGLALHLSLL